MTKLSIPVSYRPNVGYVTHATHAMPKTMTALSLEGLRKRVLVVAALGRRPNEQIAVTLDLDPTAQAEHDRRRALSGVRDGAARPPHYEESRAASQRASIRLNSLTNVDDLDLNALNGGPRRPPLR